MDACKDADLKAVLKHNRDEEKGTRSHDAGMDPSS